MRLVEANRSEATMPSTRRVHNELLIISLNDMIFDGIY